MSKKKRLNGVVNGSGAKNGKRLPPIPNGRMPNMLGRSSAARAKVPLNTQRLAVNASITSRSSFIRSLMDDRRDLNKECGYPETGDLISLGGFGTRSIFKELYDRNPVAARVVEVFCEEAWKTQPLIYEDETTEEESTCFELAWKQVSRSLGGANWYKDEKYNPIWEYLHRVDVLSGIGQFGVLVIGCDDGLDMAEPAFDPCKANQIESDSDESSSDLDDNEETNADTGIYNWGGAPAPGGGEAAAAPAPEKPKPAKTKPPIQDDIESKEQDEEQVVKTKRKLTFLRAFDQNQVQIASFDTDPKSPRYGQPALYNVTLVDPNDVQGLGAQQQNTIRVHWTRVLHVVDNARSNDVFGIPRMRPVLNRLLDIEKVTASSGEMYWYGAFPGLAANAIPTLGGDVTLDMDQITSHMEAYSQGLQRFLAMSGMTVSTLSPTVSDPTPQVTLYIQAICIKLGIPIRIFMGSERGELSSGQDADTWNDRLARRQAMYLVPRLVVPFINRLILMEILPTPEKFSVHWPKPQLAPQDLAALGLQKTQALAAYISGQCNSAIALQDYLVEFLGFEEDVAVAMVERAAADIQEEDAAATEDPLKMDAQFKAEEEQAQMEMQAEALKEGALADQENQSAMMDKGHEQAIELEKVKQKGRPTVLSANEFSPEARRAALEARRRKAGATPADQRQARQARLQARGKRVGKAQAAAPAPEKKGKPSYGKRADGTQKGHGFFGELKMKDGSGNVATEISVGVEFDGKETEIPSLVPGLSPEEKNYLLKGGDPSKNKSIMDKAVEHAKKRLKAGKSPFAEDKESPTNNEGDMDDEIYGMHLLPEDERELVIHEDAGEDISEEVLKGLELLGNLGPTVHGGPGSGNFGHGGRPGQRGGSAPKGAGGKEAATSKDGEERAEAERRALRAEREVTALLREPKQPPPLGQPTMRARVESDRDRDGVTDASRVGVPGKVVPPPPPIAALPNLTPDERAVEQAFIKAFNDDPQAMADDFRKAVLSAAEKKGGPPTFGTDDAKELSADWSGDQLSLAERSENRATYNLALHQVANATAKQALLDHMDTMQPGEQILVTVGGCGAGKGYALGNNKETGEPFVPQAAALKNESGAVWDSAGDQNATENPWILEEAEKRGLKVAYAYVHADPEKQWADPERGVVKRAQDPKDGRMVDARVFADSYAIGARNHQAFYEANKNNPNCKFVFVANGNPPVSLDGIPEKALSLDRKELAEFADKTVLETPGVPPHIRRGATIGKRIWGDKA